MTDSKKIGARIRQAREAKGYSQVALAKLIGIAQPSLSQLETGGSKVPGTRTLLAIGRILGTNSDWILDGRGDPYSEQLSSQSEEIELLEMWRSLPSDKREAVTNMIKLLQGGK